MALTPDEVVNKTFQPTKFREGYDQDEVDDFLDEVVGELRRLLAENEDLRTKLAACESRGGGPTTTPGVTQANAPASLDKAPDSSGVSGTEEESSAAEAPDPVRPAAQASQTQGQTAPAPDVAAADPQAATGMLALAQRLHDEHVRSGEEQRDRLVAEAQTHAEQVVTEAEQRKTQTLGSLEQERSLLERKIDELRSFERDYRTRLKSYLETQLRDLDAKATVVPSGVEGGASDRQ